MYASHDYRHVLVVPTGSKMKTTMLVRSQDRLDNFVLALFHCAPCIYRTTAWRIEVSCVFMFGICCVIAVSLFLYYTGLREYCEVLCVMFGMCCVIAVSLFLYYTELRETWSDCVFMFGICCVIAVSLFLYYTGWWLYIGSLMNNAR